MSVIAQLFTRRMLICVFTGFSSGLPLYLLFNLVPAWLRSEQVDLKTIGLFALIQFPYTWKFLWSPLLDRYVLPLLGRRRGWMLLTQIGLLAVIASMGAFSPQSDLRTIAYIATLLAFLSATQDIVLDAYRRELLEDSELGLGNAVHVNAYRIAGLVPGSLSLILADFLPWSMVFIITALFMLPGMAMTLMVKEPLNINPPKSLRDAVVEPFHEFITRHGWQSALLILTFLILLQTRRQHVHRAGHPVLHGYGILQNTDRPDRQKCGPVARCNWRITWRIMDGKDRHQSRLMVVWSSSSGINLWFLLAGIGGVSCRNYHRGTHSTRHSD